MTTVPSVLLTFLRHPLESVVWRWNWKTAVISATARGILFFIINSQAGWAAATLALLVEFFYRAAASGTYGAMTQAFRKAQPAWAASLAALLLLPAVGHTLEYIVHSTAGTPLLYRSIFASVALTGFSTLFHLFAMRRGIFVVGEDGSSFVDDLKRLPGTAFEFFALVPRMVLRWNQAE